MSPDRLPRAALVFLAAASVVIVAAGFISGRWAVWVSALLVASIPVALTVLALGRRGIGKGLGIALVAWWAVLESAWVALLVLHDAGLPAVAPALAVQLLGLLAVPLVLAAGAYALTFGRHGVGEDDLARLRRAAKGGDGGAAGS